MFCGVKTLVKQSLQHLSVQHSLNADSEHDTDSVKVTIIDPQAGVRCQLPVCVNRVMTSTMKVCLEPAVTLRHMFYKLTAEKVKLSKKVLWSRDIEFDVSENVGELRRHLRSHITRLCKGKQPEWSRNQRAESESEHNSHANVTCIGSLSSFSKCSRCCSRPGFCRSPALLPCIMWKHFYVVCDLEIKERATIGPRIWQRVTYPHFFSVLVHCAEVVIPMLHIAYGEVRLTGVGVGLKVF